MRKIKPVASPPSKGRIMPDGAADPRFKAALLRVFQGHPLQRAVESDRFQLGAIPRDRPVAEATLREMEADPAAFRARFGGGE